MTNNYQSREHMILSMLDLCLLCDDMDAIDKPHKMSNIEILRRINTYLKSYDCLPYSNDEIQLILKNINND